MISSPTQMATALQRHTTLEESVLGLAHDLSRTVTEQAKRKANLPTLDEVQLGPLESPEIGPKCGCICFHLDRILGHNTYEKWRWPLRAALDRAKIDGYPCLVSASCPNNLMNRKHALEIIEHVVREMEEE